MKYLPFIFSIFIFSLCNALYSQEVPSIEWQKCLGGSEDDNAYSIQQTTDGGFIFAGQSLSNDGDVSGNHGGDPIYGGDYWIAKLDILGNLVWQKCLGGSDPDVATAIQQTTDGGFIVAGWSQSNDGDVSGNHGSKDYWIVKLDPTGNLEWQKSFGGSDFDEAQYVKQTTDGGFIVAGSSLSNDGDVSGNHGGYDYWILKLNALGSLIWQKTLGGSDYDKAYSIQQTDDGGIIVAGYGGLNGGDVSGNHGWEDYWIAKLDSDGILLWQKSFGGTDTDISNSIQQTTDDGFILAGRSLSNNGDVSGNHGGEWFGDYWIVKTDMNAAIEWQKCLGGNNDDRAFSAQQLINGEFIISGVSSSNDGDVSGNHGSDDSWIVQLDSDGYIVWQQSYGGTSAEYPFSIQQIADNGFIIAGMTASNDGDVSGNHGSYDCWIVKLSENTSTGVASPSNDLLHIFPNPVQDVLTIESSIMSADIIIRVHDFQGRKFSVTSKKQNAQLQLNISDLNDGLYTLQIIDTKTGNHEQGEFMKTTIQLQ